MKYTFCIAITLLTLMAASALGNGGIAIRFSDATLDTLLRFYSSLSGKRVEIVKGVEATFRLESEKSLSKEEALALVESELKANNIGLFQIASNRLVATWIDPSIVPKPKHTPPAGTTSYVERMRARRAEKRKEMESNKTQEATPL